MFQHLSTWIFANKLILTLVFTIAKGFFYTFLLWLPKYTLLTNIKIKVNAIVKSILFIYNDRCTLMGHMISANKSCCFASFHHRRASLTSSWSLWTVCSKARTKQSIPSWVTRRHASSPRTEAPTKTSNQRTSLFFKSKMSSNLILSFCKIEFLLDFWLFDQNQNLICQM